MELSDVEVNVLSVLSEAAEEELATLANTVLGSAEERGDPQVLQVLNASLDRLRQRQLIGYAYYKDGWQDLSDDQLAPFVPIRRCLAWDDAGARWRWNAAECGQERLIVVLLEKGRRAIAGYRQRELLT